MPVAQFRERQLFQHAMGEKFVSSDEAVFQAQLLSIVDEESDLLKIASMPGRVALPNRATARGSSGVSFNKLRPPIAEPSAAGGAIHYGSNEAKTVCEDCGNPKSECECESFQASNPAAPSREHVRSQQERAAHIKQLWEIFHPGEDSKTVEVVIL